jgi:cytolysin (calcineurin-like family phosphatase)
LRSLLGAAAGALLLIAAGPASPRPFTFFVASDSHFGADGMEETNRALVEELNALPGTDYPDPLGGRVQEPRGVLFTGDTTDNGLAEEFALFEKFYGLTGKEGLLRFPIFEAIGNHDVNSDLSPPVKRAAQRRHAGIDYSWDWEGVHFICLDMYPDAATRAWLAQDLTDRPPETPLVVFFHYSLSGNFSRFWPDEDKDAFGEMLVGRNLLAIFHGHEHRVGHYVWRDHDVFRPGAPRHFSHFFLAVEVRAKEMVVAARDFDNKRWQDSWVVGIRR